MPIGEGDKIRIGDLNPTFSEAHKRAQVQRNPSILRVPQNVGTKSEVGVVTRCFSGAHKWAESLRNPCILGCPLPGDKIRNGCLITAFSEAHKWAEVLRNPCVLGGPRQRDKIRSGNLNLAVSGAHKIRYGYLPPCLVGGRQGGATSHVSPAFSRVPKQGDKIIISCLTLSFSGAHKCAELLRNTSIVRVPKKGGKYQKWVPVGRNGGGHPVCGSRPSPTAQLLAPLVPSACLVFSSSTPRVPVSTRWHGRRVAKPTSGCVSISTFGCGDHRLLPNVPERFWHQDVDLLCI